MDMEKLASLFEAVKVMPLRSSDFVIFRTPVSLSLDQQAEIYATLEEALDHSRILIVDQGADIEVLRREREPEARRPSSPSGRSCTDRSAATRSRSRRLRPRRARCQGQFRDRPRARQGPAPARVVLRRPPAEAAPKRPARIPARRRGRDPAGGAIEHPQRERPARQVAEDRLADRGRQGDRAALHATIRSRTWSSTAPRRT
jgi:hypothetical protein